jgi:aryl-alcohol dehydrogenase-like predicted oxidoreductase
MTTANDANIPRRKLGTSGLEISELTMGTWGLIGESYGPVFPEQRERALKRALEQGIGAFDMAPTWGEEGASEREVAAVVVGAERDKVIYITRAGQVALDTGLEPRFDAASLRKECEASLTRLKTDRIDVWLLHEPSEEHLQAEEIRKLVEALVREGKVRCWGASVSSVASARVALECAAQVLCLPFHLLRPELVWDIGGDASARGAGILARSVLSHGLLTGRFTARKRFAPDDHRAHRWSPEALGARVQQASELSFLVNGPVLSLAAAAERFVLAHEVVSSAIVGPRTAGQVEACVHALSGTPYMSESDLLRVRRMPRV